MPSVAISGAVAERITRLRWPRDVEGRVGRPAHVRRRLAAVVVRAAAPGKTMRVPPMPQTTAIRVPATDRMHSLEEGLLVWLAMPAISAQCLTARDQAEHQCRYAYMASHTVSSPTPFDRQRSPGSPGSATPESPGRPGFRVRAEAPATAPVTTTGRGRPTTPSASPAPPLPSSVRRHAHPSGGAAPSLLRGLDRR